MFQTSNFWFEEKRMFKDDTKNLRFLKIGFILEFKEYKIIARNKSLFKQIYPY